MLHLKLRRKQIKETLALIEYVFVKDSDNVRLPMNANVHLN